MSVLILNGDSRKILQQLPSESVHCVVTSPPYFGLRDYGHEDQIGLEKTPEAYVQEMVSVFREVRRVLRNDGTLWLNIGDSYASAWACNRRNIVGAGSLENGKRDNRPNRLVDGLKEKDLIGIPWMLAFALRADGWYLRQDIIWNKPNPMPESIKDRCTKAHEYIFLLSKSQKYYFDSEAMKEPGVIPAGTKGAKGSAERQGQKGVNARPPEYKIYDGMRNRRSVWTVTTKPFSGAHFATFPPDLIEPCILAGCPKGGMVLDPFGGAGTTGLTAHKLEREAILIELNAEYVKLTANRLTKASIPIMAV